jgi:hypothetical protein
LQALRDDRLGTPWLNISQIAKQPSLDDSDD